MKLELNKVYRDEYGEQWKIIAKHKDGIRYIGVPSTLIGVSFFTEAGGNCYNQLTELVGDDFKEELFKIEFKASILHSEADITKENKETVLLSVHDSEKFTRVALYLGKNWDRRHNCKVTIEEVRD